MADLKAGTTVGGTLVWTQGNFPLFPTGNTLLYKTFKVYSENDKPQAVDNDFVSKANGGTYSGDLILDKKSFVVTRTDVSGTSSNSGGLFPGNGDGATYDTTNIDIQSWHGIGFKSNFGTNGRTLVIDAREGNLISKGTATFAGIVSSNASPTAATHLTRKDYVDGQINTVTNNANSRVLRSGDTMTGALTAPNMISTNAATATNHVPQLGQVVQRGVVLDYGIF